MKLDLSSAMQHRTCTNYHKRKDLGLNCWTMLEQGAPKPILILHNQSRMPPSNYSSNLTASKKRSNPSQNKISSTNSEAHVQQ